MPYNKPEDAWIFSDETPLLPPALGADPYDTDSLADLPSPWEHRRQCWLMSPPICPECGFRYRRPVNVNRQNNPFRTSCSQGCHSRWNARLRYLYHPERLRYEYWPGRDENVPHPDIVALRKIWNKDGDRQDPTNTRSAFSTNICSHILSSFPTNDFPLQPDRRGKHCRMAAGTRTDHPGYGPCWKHDNTARTNKANRELAMERMAEQDYILGAPIDVTPEEAILNEVHRTAGHVAWLFDKIQVIGRNDEDEALKQFTKLGVTPSVWMDMYQKERDHLMAVAKTAASMGIAARQIEIAEEQGRMLATVLQKFLESPVISLTPQQRVDAPEVIRELMTTVTATATEVNPRQRELVEHSGDTDNPVDPIVIDQPSLFDEEP